MALDVVLYAINKETFLIEDEFWLGGSGTETFVSGRFALQATEAGDQIALSPTEAESFLVAGIVHDEFYSGHYTQEAFDSIRAGELNHCQLVLMVD